MDVREAANQRLSVERLEFVKLGCVDDTRDHLANLVGRARVRGHDAVEVVRREQGILRLADFQKWMLHPVEAGDDAARDADGVTVVGGIIVGHARLPAVHVGAAQLLRAHVLAGRRLHERRPAEENRALIAHDDALVRHRRHVGASGGAGAHHRGDLWDPGGREPRLVVEDPAEMLAVGEDLGLMRQIGARPERFRPAAAGTRRRSRPCRRTASGSRARCPARANASSRSSGSRCRP